MIGVATRMVTYAQYQRQQQHPHQGIGKTVPVAGTISLCDKTGGTHAQETETPVEKAEYQRTERDRADRLRTRQMPDDRGVDRTDQRHRDIGQDDWSGEHPHLAVESLKHRVRGPALHSSASGRLPDSIIGRQCHMLRSFVMADR